MQPSTLFRSLVLALPALSFTMGAQANEPKTTVAERPSWKPGDRWEYRVLDAWNNKETDRVTMTFERQDGDRLIGQRQAKTQAEPVATRADLDGNACAPMLDSDQEVCARVLGFPLTVGAQVEHAKYPFANRQGHSQARCKVAAAESVTVPAGRFDAWRIDCKGYWNFTAGSPSSGTLNQTYWYAPAAGRAVRLYTESFTSQGAPNNKTLVELVAHTYTAP